MNLHLLPAGGMPMPIEMTTKEIADRTEKEHRNVMRDTRKMLVELHGKGGLLRFEQSYRAGNGKLERCYRLPKREVMILVTGWSIPLRAAIVDRIQELEAAQQGGYVSAAPQLPAAPEYEPASDYSIASQIRLLKDGMMPAIIGGVRNAVVRPISEKIDKLKSWAEDRFVAARARDIMALDKLDAIEVAQAEIEKKIEKVFVTVTRPAAELVEEPVDPERTWTTLQVSYRAGYSSTVICNWLGDGILESRGMTRPGGHAWTMDQAICAIAVSDIARMRAGQKRSPVTLEIGERVRAIVASGAPASIKLSSGKTYRVDPEALRARLLGRRK